MVPQCQPVVEPDRQTEAPSMATLEPATVTVPPLPFFTSGLGVQSAFTATQAKSLPGKVDPWKTPWAARLTPVVVAPALPQWPALTNPFWVPRVTENPIEQRLELPM